MAKKDKTEIMLPPWGGVWHLERGTLPPMEGNVLDSNEEMVRLEGINTDKQKIDIVVMKSTITAYIQLVTEEVKEA